MLRSTIPMPHRSLLLWILALSLKFPLHANLSRPNPPVKRALPPENKLEGALQLAKEYLEKNKQQFKNQKYLVLIDYGQPSNVKRFHLVELPSYTLKSYLVAHGKGSDPLFSGEAQYFGDKPESRMTSLGFFKTKETYFGIHGYSLRLEGLNEENKNALSRAIVIHAAAYVSEKRRKVGRSWGCPALPPEVAKEIIDKIKEGALIYSFAR